MAAEKIKVEIAGTIDLEKRKTIELQVDTGVMVTYIPRRILTKLGIQPKKKKQVRTPDGLMVERDIGSIFIFYNNRKTLTTVVFSDNDREPVIGNFALDALGLEYNYETGKLEQL
ncbi:hypothetical protein JXI42_06305 [bacterium]|nr:hypothetical protein [bacterium]